MSHTRGAPQGKRGEIQGHKKETGGTFMSHTRGTPQGTRGQQQEHKR